MSVAFRGALIAALLLGGCRPAVPPGAPAAGGIPVRGAPGTLDVGSWNLEWFGSTEHGPADEALQLRNVSAVLHGVGLDVWGVEEVVDHAHWDRLRAALPEFDGVLSGDSSVTDGPAFYSADEQKVGILFRRSLATLLGARLILTANDYDVGRRPPLEVRLRVRRGGATGELVVIVMHAKSSQDSSSWQRRRNAGVALKAYLDATYPSQRVLVIGDWNDDIDASINPALPTPFAALVQDSARYRFATASISAAHISSMTEYPEMIDHHLASNEMYADYLPGSAEVLRGLLQIIPDYASTTTDHFPVVTRYRWP
jgi:endonuclease/exonuclease/phosphatase family metal-dependent hydrolase